MCVPSMRRRAPTVEPPNARPISPRSTAWLPSRHRYLAWWQIRWGRRPELIARPIRFSWTPVVQAATLNVYCRSGPRRHLRRNPGTGWVTHMAGIDGFPAPTSGNWDRRLYGARRTRTAAWSSTSNANGVRPRGVRGGFSASERDGVGLAGGWVVTAIVMLGASPGQGPRRMPRERT